MKTRHILHTLLAACAFATASLASATPILLVNANGILTGANNVVVDNVAYDVTFADGSCNSLYGGCKTSAFTFQNSTSAGSAAQALLNQVFLNTSVGQFDSQPGKTFGCIGANQCWTYIAYGLSGNSVSARAAFNDKGDDNRGLPTTALLAKNVNYTSDISRNFAIFQLAKPASGNVPEPDTIALMGLAAAGLAFARRRKG